jgi:integrase
LNPGSHAPQACILIQNQRQREAIHAPTADLSMLDDGPTAKKANSDEIRIHGFSLNLDPSDAFQDYNQRIEETLLKMLSDQKAENTRRQVCNTLKRLNRIADLMNPESVSQAIGNMRIAKSSKQKLLNNYDYFAIYNNIGWIKPTLRFDPAIPIVPTNSQAEEIIKASTSIYTATIFRILLEAGFEGEELHNTTLERNVDTEQGIISVEGNKQHNGRACKLNKTNTELLRLYITHWQSLKNKPDQKHPFPSGKIMGEQWRKARKRAAEATGNHELLKIPLKGLRNLSGINVYRETKDPWTVMFHMGHKSLLTTQHYIQSMKPYYTNPEEGKYISKCATTPEEAMELINHGFTEASVWGEKHIFKKKIDT